MPPQASSALVSSPLDLRDVLADLQPTFPSTVPVCQNPTGATMTAARKKAIYAIAVKYDVIIVEDDRESLSGSSLSNPSSSLTLS